MGPVDATVTKMHASGVNHRRFSFGDYVLDVDRGALLKGGEDVPLRPKTFEVFNYLVRHAGLLVSKEDLHAAGKAQAKLEVSVWFEQPQL